MSLSYETPKPQSILHQLGRLGSKIGKTRLMKRKGTKDENKSENGEGVFDENGIFHEIGTSGREDFSSVASEEDFEDNLFDDETLPQATEKCDENSQTGKAVSNVEDTTCDSSNRSSYKDHRRRSNSFRVDNAGEVF
mmetsp:Transcript_33047/g.79881  ORF Transcript_33047/g.79881 Transcript_33047/m.79881 type:complete len:137 (+) Transcript_33047:21-431(+)